MIMSSSSSPNLVGHRREGSTEPIFHHGVRVSGRVWIRTQSGSGRKHKERCQGKGCRSVGARNQQRRINIFYMQWCWMLLVVCCCYFCCCCLVGVQGFGIDYRRSVTTTRRTTTTRRRSGVATTKRRTTRGWSTEILLSVNENVEDDEDLVEKSDFGEGDVGDPGVTIEDLNWRVQKLRLEEENKRRFLKAKPRFLPYEECSRWVQAWGKRWTSETDWYVELNCMHPWLFVVCSSYIWFQIISVSLEETTTTTIPF
jgi:hypothetical protein